MIKNKRGLSQVVTTVIIILLSLAAIAIIWTFVRPVIENSSSQINADCLSVDFDAVCKPTLDTITVTRKAGPGDLKGFTFIAGGSEITPATSPATAPSELGSANYIFNSGDVTAGSDIQVAAQVGDTNQLCAPKTFTC